MAKKLVPKHKRTLSENPVLLTGDKGTGVRLQGCRELHQSPETSLLEAEWYLHVVISLFMLCVFLIYAVMHIVSINVYAYYIS